PPVPLKLAVDSVIGSHPLPAWLTVLLPAGLDRSPTTILWLAAAVAVVVGCLVYLQALVAWVLQTVTGEQLVLDFRATLFAHVQRISISYHDRRGSTDTTYRIQHDAPAIQYVVLNGATALVVAACTLAGKLVISA